MSNAFVTTITMPFELRAKLDVARAVRGRRTGKRPAMRELIEEALADFVSAELSATDETTSHTQPANVND